MEFSIFNKEFSINCNGTLLDLSIPKVMAIINVTPDSFYDGGKYNNSGAFEKRIDGVIEQGADIIDVGGVSTRPGADMLTSQEELERIEPVLNYLNTNYSDIPISVDTFRADVANKVISEYGVSIINDISGGTLDASMFDVVAKNNAIYVLMHIQGDPSNMQDNPQYSDITQELLEFFAERYSLLKEKGVVDVIIDPGFGFGKTMDHNYELISSLDHFKILELPMMVGVSRKSMIHKYLNVSPEESLNGTSVINTMALSKGANILRVHDVKEAIQVVQLFQKAKHR